MDKETRDDFLDSMGVNETEKNNFELWLRSVCFQKPTPEAYDLAKSAWKHQQDRISMLAQTITVAQRVRLNIATLPLEVQAMIDNNGWLAVLRRRLDRFHLPVQGRK